jgi:dTMP kinase
MKRPEGKPPAPRRGRFIVFEGIDGSGKSTTLATVAAALRKEGREIVETREETTGETGQWVKRSIAEKWDSLTTSFLFLADRATHVAELEGHLASGRTVLCDRFLHSTLAYQSITLRARLRDPVAFLRNLHEGWCPQPDHVILFHADPARCLERIRKRGQQTPYEKVEFLQQVQQVYGTLAKAEPQRFVTIDAERDLVAVAAEATDLIRGWLR